MLPKRYKWKIDNQKKTGENIVDVLLKQRGVYEGLDKALIDANGLYKPELLMDMDKAITRLEQAFTDHEKVTVYGDYDVDGITATSIVYDYFSRLGFQMNYYIPDRIEEGYGINIKALEEIKAAGTTLIVTVDTGIAAVQECKRAREMGLDIIITDHHELQEELPEAVAIINPKRGGYPYKMLAGVAVAYKMLQAYENSTSKAKGTEYVDLFERYADIITIGTIADIVPLLDENRSIVKLGLSKIEKTNNIGLQELLKVCGAKKTTKMDTRFVGFGIGPRINATGRIGSAKKGVELLVEGDRQKAREIAEYLDNENINRQNIEANIFQEVKQLINSNQKISNNKVIVVASEGWHHGVVGIVASRVKDLYYKPNIILGIEGEYATGSARSVDGFNIFDAIESCKDILVKYGGHSGAAGLTIETRYLEEFTLRLNDYAKLHMQEDCYLPEITIDEEVKIEEISLPYIEDLKRLEPYGKDMTEPIFKATGTIKAINAIGKEHNTLKIILEGKGRTVEAIGFRMGYYSKYFKVDNRVSIVGTLSINEYNGNKNTQMIIKDIKAEHNNEKYGEELEASLKKGMLEGYFSQHNTTVTRTDCILVYKKLTSLIKLEGNEWSIFNTEFAEEFDKTVAVMAVLEDIGVIQLEHELPYVNITENEVKSSKPDLDKSRYNGTILKV